LATGSTRTTEAGETRLVGSLIRGIANRQKVSFFKAAYAAKQAFRQKKPGLAPPFLPAEITNKILEQLP